MKNGTRFALFSAALLLLGIGVARAQTLTVTRSADDFGNVASCTSVQPNYTCGTLRDAVTFSNALAAAAGTATVTVNFNIPASDAGCTAGLCTVSLVSVLPATGTKVTMTIDASTSTQSIVISGATQGAQSNPTPGLISNNGPLTLNALTITGFSCNQNMQGCNFSGINAYYAPLTVNNSTFVNNSFVNGLGAAILMQNAALTITNSTFSGNSAGSGGGAIYTNGTTTITNSTFYSNSTVSGGGAIELDGSSGATMLVTNSTFASNTATNGGNAIYAPAFGKVTLNNTIIAAEGASNAANCLAAPNSSQFVDGGGNLDDDTTNTCNFGETNSGYGVPDSGTEGLNLGQLANNGGPTQTIALLGNSVAITEGVLANCPATDQRGVARPVGGEFGTCSSGAYQYTAAPPPVQNGTGTAAGCTSPAICNITGGENQSIAAGTSAAAAALAALTGGAAVITENVCTVAMDPRKICPPGIPSSPYYNSATLPLAAMCPSLPSGGAGNSVVPDYLCGDYGAGGAGTGTGFAVIQGIANGVNGIPGLLDMNDANPDAFFPPGGNPATECSPVTGAFIDNISDGWGPWSLSPIEGTIPEGKNITELTDGCGGNKQTSGGMSITVTGLTLNLANATQELGKLPKTLVNFAEYKYVNLGLELASDPIDTPNKVELLAILAQSALFLAAGKNGCAEDTLYEADRYVINNASHFHGAPALDPNSYGRTRARILNLFFTLFTRIDGNLNPITDLGPNVGFPLLAPSLSGPPASCSVKYLGPDGY
jgi:predicted outer membrane repeat protein